MLGLHRSDLFIIAGRAVPDDLAAPHREDPCTGIGSMTWTLSHMRPAAVLELHHFVRSLPHEPRPPGPRPPASASLSRGYPNTAGGLILRLHENRNLSAQTVAEFLMGLSHGPMLSASTVMRIAEKPERQTAERLAGLTPALDISTRDLGALTGIDLSSAPRLVNPSAAEVAALVWSARRLTAGQARQLADHASAMRKAMR